MQSSLVLCMASVLVTVIIAAPNDMKIADIPIVLLDNAHGDPSLARGMDPNDLGVAEDKESHKVMNAVETAMKDSQRLGKSLNGNPRSMPPPAGVPSHLEKPNDHDLGDSAANDPTLSGLGMMQSLGQRATGQAHSVTASSAAECAKLCVNHDRCDAVNFHMPSRKCRFFHRCVPYVLHSDSKDYIHFSKRLPVREKGWVYDAGSDSCLRAIGPASVQAVGAKRCAALGGRLAALTGPDLNKLAAKLLRNAAAQYAWIGLKDSLTEGNPVHINGEKVSSTGFFPRASQQHRNDLKRNCWSISDVGEWAEHSCKNRRQFSICQILPY